MSGGVREENHAFSYKVKRRLYPGNKADWISNYVLFLKFHFLMSCETELFCRNAFDCLPIILVYYTKSFVDTGVASWETSLCCRLGEADNPLFKRKNKAKYFVSAPHANRSESKSQHFSRLRCTMTVPLLANDSLSFIAAIYVTNYQVTT